MQFDLVRAAWPVARSDQHFSIPLRQMRIELTPMNAWDRDPQPHRGGSTSPRRQPRSGVKM